MGMVTLRNDSKGARVVYELSGAMTMIEPGTERTLAISDATEKQIRLGMNTGDKFKILSKVKVSDLNYVDGKPPAGAEPISDPPSKDADLVEELIPPPKRSATPPEQPKRATPKRRKRKAIQRLRARQKAED